MVKKNKFLHAITSFLFPEATENRRMSFFLLALRVLLGILLMMHGIQKIQYFDTLQHQFPDPLGVGSAVSVSLAIFAEVACSLGFIFGALYRLALIPMIFTMIIACFVAHAGDPFSDKELPFAYMCLFILMYMAGPGKIALDYFISERISRKNDV